MNSYDFGSLNDKEFEAFVTDLLSEVHGVRVERFKPGRDLGVDGRWFAQNGGEVVLQCKHWLKTGSHKLLKHLRSSERPKLDHLKPLRYILATSVPLSRKDKKEIFLCFQPYILSETDIYGQEDLNDLLGRYPTVERRNYKLWLSSSGVLSQILNNAIIGRSRAELESMREDAVLYVPTGDYDRAKEHLDNHRVLILTGEPGIGKTTLARQLILECVVSGFTLVAIEESISEAEAVYDDSKQVFYFDDFLGRTFLEALKTKQDTHIANFMRRVSKDSSKRFVLTSRTNILNQGAVLSDLFSGGQITKNSYELEVKHLTVLDRARILYNHIWHSQLAPDYIDELYAEKRYHKIIHHANYNPRLISFILDNDKVASLHPSKYWEYVCETLKNPQDVWNHFFASQLTQDCRDLVHIAVLNGTYIAETDLRDTFISLPNNTINAGLAYHNFQIALRHAVGSVLNRTIGGRNSRVTYSLFNPSIADYVLRYLAGSHLWGYYFPRIRTTSALHQIEQMHTRQIISQVEYIKTLRAIGNAEIHRSGTRDGYSLHIARMLAQVDELKGEFSQLLDFWIMSPNTDVIVSRVEDYISLLLAWEGIVQRDVLVQREQTISKQLAASPLPIQEPELLSRLLEEFEILGLPTAMNNLREQFLEEWGTELRDTIRSENLLEGYFHTDEIDLMRDVLEQFVTSQLLEYGIMPSQEEVMDICDLVDLEDVIEDNIMLVSRNGRTSQSISLSERGEINVTATVDDLFDRSG